MWAKALDLGAGLLEGKLRKDAIRELGEDLIVGLTVEEIRTLLSEHRDANAQDDD